MTTRVKTVALIPRVSAELDLLAERTGLSGTDLINRAISLYEFIDAQILGGAEVVVRAPDGTCREMRLG